MPRVAVTGALSYTGRYLSRLLFDAGSDVVNLSHRSVPLVTAAPLSAREVEGLANLQQRKPLDFRFAGSLENALEGCEVLYCTHWVRFVSSSTPAHGDCIHRKTADDLGQLFLAAKRVGVRKVVLVSHTHTDERSPFRYVAGKARAVAALRGAGLEDYAVVRPCGVFGDSAAESILLNNAAWVMRRVPLFLLPGDGSARFQPVHVRDQAQLMFELGSTIHPAGSPHHGAELDSVGPDAPTALEFFKALASATGCNPSKVVASGLPTSVVTALSRPINWLQDDILLDGDDLDLLHSGLTVADDPSDHRIASRRSVFAWMNEHGDELGRKYISSRQRYYKVHRPAEG